MKLLCLLCFRLLDILLLQFIGISSADYDKMYVIYTNYDFWSSYWNGYLIWTLSVEIISSSMNPATKLVFNFLLMDSLKIVI